MNIRELINRLEGYAADYDPQIVEAHLQEEIDAINKKLDVASATSSPRPEPTPAPQPVPATPAAHIDFNNMYVDPHSQAATAAKTNPLIEKIASQPTFFWLGGWTTDFRKILDDGKGKTVGASVYNRPGRDNGQYSAGGAPGFQAYKTFIDGLANTVHATDAVVWAIEADGIDEIDNYSDQEKANRYECLKYEINTLKTKGKTFLCVGWHPVDEIVKRYNAIGAEIDGFALNVSGFDDQASMEAKAAALFQVTGKPSIIDTSRNGNGGVPYDPAHPEASWCNPPGRALGLKPGAVNTQAVIAHVWLKRPGESDGTYNGGPAAGTWFESYAEELVRNTKW